MHFFRYRSMMKVAVLIFTVVNAVPLYFLLAFLLFDGAYHIVELISRRKKPGSSDLSIPWFGQNFSFLSSTKD